MGRCLVSIALCGMIAGCGGGSVSCTAVGCPFGLRIVLTSPPSGPYRVEATAPGDPTVYAQDCSGGPCTIMFPTFRAPQSQITVISTTGTTTYDKAVPRVATYPNGPDCGPCEGTQAVTVP